MVNSEVQKYKAKILGILARHFVTAAARPRSRQYSEPLKNHGKENPNNDNLAFKFDPFKGLWWDEGQKLPRGFDGAEELLSITSQMG